jgi:ketosteroid isomerase-like protein
MTQPNNSHHSYKPATSMTTGQTLLWFLGGITAMFVLVSIAFTIKLAADGRLSVFGKGNASRVAPQASTPPAPGPRSAASEAVTPPISASTVNPGANGGFVSGSENILPPEAAHLAKAATERAAPGEPEATKPASAPQVASPPAAAMAPTETIPDTLNAWAADWGRKDIDAYLKHYAADFQPAKGLDRPSWAAQRKQRLSRPETISVTISGLEIKTTGDKASVRFTQIYRAGEQSLRETKTLELALRDGHWLIQQERIGG